MGSWDLPIKERKFENVLTQIVIDTIKLDVRFTQIINLYFTTDTMFKDFNSELLAEDEELSEKAKFVYFLTKNKLQSYPDNLLDKISRCLEIRNKLVHTLWIEDDKSEGKEKVYSLRKGKQKLKVSELEVEFYENYNLIISSCQELGRLLWAETIATDIKDCNVHFIRKINDSISICDITLKDSQGKTAWIYHIPKRAFNAKDYEEEIKKEVKDYLGKLFPLTKDKKFTIYVSELEMPEQDYPNPPEDSEPDYSEE